MKTLRRESYINHPSQCRGSARILLGTNPGVDDEMRARLPSYQWKVSSFCPNECKKFPDLGVTRGKKKTEDGTSEGGNEEDKGE